MILWAGPPIVPNYREYIETPLTATLISNTIYHVVMYVSLANNSNYKTDDLGIYFSDTLISGINNWHALPFIPQIINNSGYISDTVNWTLISGNYMASGGENYMIIGNFKHDANSNAIFIGINSVIDNMSYIHIDDVSLSVVAGVTVENSNSIKVYPNPFSDKINITTKGNQLFEVSLYDVTSRKILSQSFANSPSINAEHLAKGLYIYEIRSREKVIKKGKIVKE